MSDTALNKIIQYGTDADRIAFTPDPAVGSQVLYFWYVTDSAPDLYVWDGSAWVLVNTGGGGGITELTGDVTAGPGSGSQAATIANNAVTTSKILNDNVTYAKIQNVSATDRILGRDTAAAGDIEELTVTGGLEFNGGPGIQRSALTGDVTASAGSNSTTIANLAVTTGKIADDAVTYAKIQDVSATDRLLGRDTAGAGNIEEIPVTSGLEFSGGPGLRLTTQARTRQIGITIDGGGVAITTGVKGYRSSPWTGTITGVRMLADQSGSAVVDIWKDTYANYPPTVADTITAAAKPTISATNKSEDTTLTGWTTSVTAGDVFGFNVDSAATIQRLTLELTIVLT